ncbi:Beta-galactosidase [Tenacibaculum sp. MAR_2009_124]|uniref:beta-galactosidase n=1 Tax=Tenacibaculum sp. MAR_2009_124 TaxID=1250059 RepID=UPI000896377B|nr:beta-galactosidase [Tenacibaculum sp. MAR_2009_124]SEC79020.1 Beta-galactosidase [Tenacibaculum sp. MAR_2009_124]
MKKITNLSLAVVFTFLSCSDNYVTQMSQTEVLQERAARVESQNCFTIKSHGELKNGSTWFNVAGNHIDDIICSVTIWDTNDENQGVYEIRNVFYNESRDVTVVHTINNELHEQENIKNGRLCSTGLKPVPSGIALRGVSQSRGYIDSKRTFYNTPVNKLDISIHQIRWSDLEPTRGNYDFSIIDDALEHIKQVNPNYKYIIRMNCGVWSPEWLKEEVGYVFWDYRQDTDNFKLPRFWESSFLNNYNRLMRTLAERYDDNPMVAGVQANGIMTFHGEVMWNRLGRPEVSVKNKENMYAAGFTPDKDIEAYRRMLRIHNNTWKKTRTIVALNPYKIDGNDSPTDEERTSELFFAARGILGIKGILGQHSLNHNNIGTKEIYQKWLLPHAKMGYPIYYQTNVFSRYKDFELDDLYETTKVAGRNYGVFVEIPNKWDCVDIKTGPGGNDCNEHHRANNMQEGRRLLKTNADNF